MSSPFSDPEAPTSTTFFTPTNFIGSDVVVVPRSIAYQEQKPWGEAKDTAYADVFIIRGEGAGAEFINTGITNSKLVSQFAQSLGKPILGRVAYGEGAAGKKPVVLATATPEVREMAGRWMQANQSKVDRAVEAARRATEKAEPVAAGSWGSPPPPPPVTNDAPPF